MPLMKLSKARVVVVTIAVAFAVCLTTVLQIRDLEEGAPPIKRALLASTVPDVKGDFVICVGPVKTGSTYLQESLCKPEAQAILAKDNYVFRGTCVNASQVEGVVQRERNNTQTDVQAVIPIMRGTKALNGIFINELMTLHDQTNQSYVSSLAQAVQNTRFPKPIIVVTYRRFFEQYLSNFNQMQRPKGGKLGWPRPKSVIGGRDIQPFRTLNQLCNGGDTNATDLFHRIFCTYSASRSQAYYDLYSQSFDNIKMMDLHDTNTTKYHATGDAYMQQFLCDVVPNAPHACAAAREGRIGDGERNPSQSLHYDAIAVMAWRRGWFGCNGIKFLKTRWLRKDAYLAIRHHQEEVLNLTWKDLPLMCPSKSDLFEFLLASLTYERQLFPTTWKSRESDHISAFWEAADNLKFCSVNASQVLDDDVWRKYIQSLGASKACGGRIKNAPAEMRYS